MKPIKLNPHIYFSLMCLATSSVGCARLNPDVPLPNTPQDVIHMLAWEEIYAGQDETAFLTKVTPLRRYQVTIHESQYNAYSFYPRGFGDCIVMAANGRLVSAATTDDAGRGHNFFDITPGGIARQLEIVLTQCQISDEDEMTSARKQFNQASPDIWTTSDLKELAVPSFHMPSVSESVHQYLLYLGLTADQALEEHIVGVKRLNNYWFLHVVGVSGNFVLVYSGAKTKIIGQIHQ